MQTVVESGVSGETIVSFEVRGNTGVLTLSATNLGDNDLQSLYRQMVALAKRSDGRLVLDATMVRPFHCRWINTLLDLHHWCKGMGGRLVIAGLPPDAEDVIRATGIARHFTIVDSREDGVRAISGRGSKAGFFDRIFGRAA